jgi:hypothetical protein
VATSNIFHASVASFHTPSFGQAYLLFFEPAQEIPCGPWMFSNHMVLYAAEKNSIQKTSSITATAHKKLIKAYVYELTHASFSPTMLS